ncbi:HD domain-containing protein [Phascolarctobacterium succinatutens]|uniref:HD domain-containing protein n=1 Tax=Phascolarctobacterium succinatutens TaxID=626940 RepID=UPI00307C78BE
MVITISFATEVYADKKILDTETPFILQAMGTARLLGDLGGSLSLVISGLLAPAVTDKLLNLKDIKERFGLRVAQLLSAYTEDKTVPWFLRKLEYLNDIFKIDDKEIQLLALALAVSELRSVYRVYKDDEAAIYALDAPCEAVGMYYKEMVQRMAVFAADKTTEHAFRELSDLYSKVFMLQS